MASVLQLVRHHMHPQERAVGVAFRRGDSDNFFIPEKDCGVLLPPSKVRYLQSRNAPLGGVRAIQSPYFIYTTRGVYFEQGPMDSGNIFCIPTQYGVKQS